ncbi:MAG: alanine--tRNA ligase [Candidatus Saccharimonadales bacterium]
MNTNEIRAAYLKFFEDRGHTIIPRANIVPKEDATTLFTGSGMQPMIPYLLGETHPDGVRLTDSQVCFRAEDIDEVGDNRHTTAFEMLGNWSLGDYFKADQIPWMFEFLTEVVNIDPQKIYVTCFIGAPEYDIPKDTEAAALWTKLFESKNIDAKQVDIGSESDGYAKGIQGGRIFFYDGSKNWWSRNGKPETTPVGDPCGPDSEMFYDFGTEHDKSFGEYCHPNCDCGRFMEIGNNVFMTYKKTSEGKFEPLAKPNIDHGSGLERIAAAAIQDPDVFKISVYWPMIETLEKLSGHKYDDNKVAMRIIADHLHAATFLAVDGVIPSNTAQGYVMRRFIRRAVRQAHTLGLKDDFLKHVIPVVTDIYRADFPEVAGNEQAVIDTLMREEHQFRNTLDKGLKVFDSIARMKMQTREENTDEKTDINLLKPRIFGSEAFKLFDTYGFPVELTIEEAKIRGIQLEDNFHDKFDYEMDMQKERSRTATAGQFKGGLVDHSEQSTKYHTATHLMYQALRQVLGNHVVQRGSNITPERLRFDFSHDGKVTPEQIAEVEKIVNEQIKADLKVTWEEHPTKVAIEELHALGQFGDRYGETVKIYRMQAVGADKPFSFEICGGPHVEHTGALAEGGKSFKIKKEESSSAGIRRIKAVLQ